MVKLNDDDIIRFLEESKKPMGPSEIVNKFKTTKNLITERNAIHYHLKNLEKKGQIIGKNGKYSINKPDFDKLKEIEEKIIQLLSTEEYSPIEIEQKLGFEEGKILSALFQLEGNGLIKEGSTSLAKRGGLIRHRRTTHDTKYCRETKYTLTYLAYSKIGICPICKERMGSEDYILAAFFKTTKYDIEPQPWKKVLIHLECIPDSKAYDIVYGKYYDSVFCDYCGLPLSPRIVPILPITYKSIKGHFYGVEIETIRMIVDLIQSCMVPSDIPIISEDKTNFVIDLSLLENSTIERIYNKHGFEIPKWISDRLKTDSNNQKYHSSVIKTLEPIEYEIISDFGYLDSDLSELVMAENFIKVLKKYRHDFPTEYDINSRIRDVWKAAQNIRNENEKKILRMYEKLLGSAGSIYNYLDETFGTEQYDFDRLKTDAPYDESSIFSQTIAFKHRNKLYHPYCAEKLGLKDNSYCNNINPKGGEKSE